MAASVLTIEELNPAGTSRVLKLSGAGLPLMGAAWGFRNNLTTTWYPGNGDEATQQVLGPQEMPSSWNGEWNRTRLSRRSNCTYTDENGTTSQVVQPTILRDALESIGRSGRRLRVTWAVTGATPDLSGKLVREGRVKQAEFSHDRVTDIRWSIQFEWVSRGGAKKIPITTRQDSVAAAISQCTTAAQQLAALYDGTIRSKIPGIPNSTSFFGLGQLESLANYPSQLAKAISQKGEQFTSTLAQIQNISTKLVNAPKVLANTFISTAKNLVDTSQGFVQTLGQVPYELASSTSRVTDVGRAASYFGQLSDGSRNVALQAQAIADQFRAAQSHAPLDGQLSPQTRAGSTPDRVLAAIITRAGDTPLSLSIRFYRSPDHGVDILTANKLPWHQTAFDQGTRIIIPVLSNAAVGG